jgi:hypothetical protein
VTAIVTSVVQLVATVVELVLYHKWGWLRLERRG